MGEARSISAQELFDEPMENEKDHPDEEVCRSGSAAEADPPAATGPYPEDPGQSEPRSPLDLSGLHELNAGGPAGDRDLLIGKSGLWPVLDDEETQQDHGLDTELAGLNAVTFRDGLDRVDETEWRSIGAGGSGSTDDEGRLVSTVKEVTGWVSDGNTISSDLPFGQVFTDGMKYYELVDWKIRITFRRTPGTAELEWSPETLEEDVRRAASLTFLEDCTVDEAAGLLGNSFSSEELGQLIEIIKNNAR
ncbi:MAG: hypothetical protein V1792_12200 [Pseudomonadota bacterium]